MRGRSAERLAVRAIRDHVAEYGLPLGHFIVVENNREWVCFRRSDGLVIVKTVVNHATKRPHRMLKCARRGWPMGGGMR